MIVLGFIRDPKRKLTRHYETKTRYKVAIFAALKKKFKPDTIISSICEFLGADVARVIDIEDWTD